LEVAIDTYIERQPAREAGLKKRLQGDQMMATLPKSTGPS
jgi:hypothetical protein